MSREHKVQGNTSSGGIDPRFSTGTRIQVSQLVQLRALAATISLRRQRKVYNPLSGNHVAAIRGRGLEYSEVRHYQPGDDIRAMDWRVTARTGHAHIKVFQEERERPLLLVCDLRASMYFGSRRAFKQVLAADICALLAWAAVNAGDRIGALLFNDQEQIDLRPKTGNRQVLQIINKLADMPISAASHPGQRLTDICQQLRRITKPGTAIYFISDWLGFDDSHQALLFDLCRHSDLTAIQLHDPLEAELPPPGQYELTDGHNRLYLDARSKVSRQSWHDAFEQQCQQLQIRLNHLKIPLIRIATSDDPLAALRTGPGIHP